MENDTEFVEKNNENVSTVKKWLRFTVLAIVNILILGFFASYFDNQPMSLLGVISVIADSMGIVLGLLGIWFFFLSENLNRTTAINLEKTTSAVNELRDQMWEMIQKTFNKFMEGEDKEKVAETKEAVEQLKQQLQQVQLDNKPIPDDILNAIDKISDRINTLEQRDRLISKPITRSTSRYILSSEITLNDIVNIVIENISDFPIEASYLYDKIRLRFGPSRNPGEFMRDLVNRGFFRPLVDKDPKSGELNGETVLEVDPSFVDYLPIHLKQKLVKQKSVKQK